MALFDERLTSGIEFERPVQEADSFSSLFNTSANYLNSYGQTRSRGPSYTERKDAADLANFQDWSNKIDEADALRRAGKPRQAEQLERKANRTFAVNGGDLGDSEVTNYYEKSTGRPMEFSGVDPQQVMLNQVRETSDYRDAYMIYAARDDLTSEQKDAMALTTIAKNQAAVQSILNTNNQLEIGNNNFTLGEENISDGFNTQSDFSIVIDTFRQQYMGALTAMGKQGRSIAPEELQAVKTRYLEMGTWINANRPKGISSETWKPIEDLYESIGAEIALAEQLNAKVSEGIQAQSTRNYLEAVRISGASEPMQWFFMNGTPETLAAYGGLSPTEIAEASQAIAKTSVSSNQAVGNPDSWDEFENIAKDMNPVGKLKQAKETAKYFRVSGDVTPENQEAFFQSVAKSAAALYSMGVEDITPAHSSELNSIFDGSIEAGLMYFDKVDPEKGRLLRTKLIEAINAQSDAANEGIVRRSDGVFRLDLDNFTYDLNETALEQLYGGRSGFVGEVPSAVREAAKAYDGDVLAMMEDEASRVPSNPALSFFLQSNAARLITRDARAIREYVQSAKTLNNIRLRLIGQAPAINDPTPRGRAEEPQLQIREEEPTEFNGILGMGGFPDTGVGPGERSLKNIFQGRKTVEEIKDYVAVGEGTVEEGYNTVLGNGRFGSPPKPLTEMTISEVYDFQEELKDNSRGKLQGVDPKLGSTAVGKYQVIKPTLQDAVKRLGLSEDTLFTPEVQDQIFELLLKDKGLEEYQSGKISTDKFQDNLSRLFASVPKADGSSRYGQPVMDQLLHG